jgi:hypothetical protein
MSNKKTNPYRLAKNICIVLLIVTITTMIAYPVLSIAYVYIPAIGRYDAKFQGQVDMIHRLQTFEGIKDNINIVIDQTYTVFKGYDLTTTYNTWWSPSKIYSNTVQSNIDYLNSLNTRLDNYIKTNEELKVNGTNQLLINDWYSTSIKNFKATIDAEGVNLVTKSAYIYNLEPQAYYVENFTIVWFFMLFIAFIIVLAVGIITASKEYDWDREHREY